MRRFKPFMRRVADWANEFSDDDDFCCPDVDIIEKDNFLIVKIDLPGVRKEDIKLNVMTDAIEVKSEKTEEKEEEDGDYYLSERYYRGYYRKISLPKMIDTETAKARFRNGVLEINALKSREEISGGVEIED
jgi:HSP20 family protein